MKIIAGAEEYLLRGTNGKGVLLIHGYTGTPAEMRLLGDHLHREGYTVLGVRLPGHGTTPEELNEMRWPQWYEAAQNACQILLDQCYEVMVVGLSMGGLLTMKLAAEMPISKAAILAAPIFVADRRTRFLPIAKYFLKSVPKGRRNYDVEDKYKITYSRMPLKALASMFDLLKQCKKEILPQIKIPCLIIQSTAEHTVQPRSAQYIYDHLGSSQKKLVWYKHSGHILTLDCEREAIFKQISKFFAK